MFNARPWMKAGIILTITLLLLLGGLGCENGEEEVINGVAEEVNGDEDVKAEEKDDPYEEAVEIEPIQKRNVVLDEDFSSVLENVFEKVPKLVSTGDIQALVYITDRVITTDDVKEIRYLLEKKGYETVGTNIDEYEYELNISIDEEIVEEKYDGDPGGNMYVRMWTAEEGENAQKVVVSFL